MVSRWERFVDRQLAGTSVVVAVVAPAASDGERQPSQEGEQDQGGNVAGRRLHSRANAIAGRFWEQVGLVSANATKICTRITIQAAIVSIEVMAGGRFVLFSAAGSGHSGRRSPAFVACFPGSFDTLEVGRANR